LSAGPKQGQETVPNLDRQEGRIDSFFGYVMILFGYTTLDGIMIVNV
jgi:hypothetical protein